MQIIRPNKDFTTVVDLKLGDCFEFSMDPNKYGICIATFLEPKGKWRWFSLTNYSTGIAAENAEIIRLNVTLTVED